MTLLQPLITLPAIICMRSGLGKQDRGLRDMQIIKPRMRMSFVRGIHLLVIRYRTDWLLEVIRMGFRRRLVRS